MSKSKNNPRLPLLPTCIERAVNCLTGSHGRHGFSNEASLKGKKCPRCNETHVENSAEMLCCRPRRLFTYGRRHYLLISSQVLFKLCKLLTDVEITDVFLFLFCFLLMLLLLLLFSFVCVCFLVLVFVCFVLCFFFFVCFFFFCSFFFLTKKKRKGGAPQ